MLSLLYIDLTMINLMDRVRWPPLPCYHLFSVFIFFFLCLVRFSLELLIRVAIKQINVVFGLHPFIRRRQRPIAGQPEASRVFAQRAASILFSRPPFSDTT